MTTRLKTRRASSTKRSNASKQSSSRISGTRLTQTHAGLVFVRRFQNSLAQTGILPRGSKIVVAVSGGPDSMALLTLLARLRDKHHFTLHVAHVNYHLRGQDSDRDETIVRDAAHAYTIPFSVFHPKSRPEKNIEEALRKIRYGYFERLRKKISYDCIVTAHTANDVAETVLMNLIRGAGLIGLSPFQRPLPRIIRPLIDFKKNELVAFLKNEGLRFRIDRSNASKRFTRNRIRHELIPLLETFNPQIVATLSKTAHDIGNATKEPLATDSEA